MSLIIVCVDNNESLAPDYTVDQKFFDQKIWELVLRYNYTLNLNGTYEAIKYMYTYWPDPHNVTLIREKYIEVHYSLRPFILLLTILYFSAAIGFSLCGS